METPTQALSRSLIAKGDQNDKFTEMWFGNILFSVADTFRKTQVLPPNALWIAFSDPNPKEYKIVKLENIPYTDHNYTMCVGQNFYYGMPILACSYQGSYLYRHYNNLMGKWNEEEIFWISMETPLDKARQVFRVHIDGSGIKTLVMDPTLSKDLMLPPHVSRYNYIIHPDNLTNN